MANIIIGISEMGISQNPGDILVSYSLGSCLGATFYDPVNKIGGMIHCMLPLSSIDPQKARHSPCMFVDTGISTLLSELFKLGCDKSDLIVKIAGSSRILDAKGLFKIERKKLCCT